jgi:hypothetical protein
VPILYPLRIEGQMRIFATKKFYAWAAGHDLSDDKLRNAVQEIQDGIVDANLGGSLYKKRVATKGRGKSGSVRTLLAYSAGLRTFFLYAFEKGDRANITQKEKTAMQIVGKDFLEMSDTELGKRIKDKSIKEIKEQ